MQYNFNALYDYVYHKQFHSNALANDAYHINAILMHGTNVLTISNALHNYAYDKQCNSNALQNDAIICIALFKFTYGEQCNFNAMPMHCMSTYDKQICCVAQLCLSLTIQFQSIAEQYTLHCSNYNVLHNHAYRMQYNSNTMQNDDIICRAIPMHCTTVLVISNLILIHCLSLQCNPNALHKSTYDSYAIFMH